jgi:hypothetical protein
VALAALSLCLRLVWPMAMPLVEAAGGDGLAAAFGEHPLCLASAHGAVAPTQTPPSPPAKHADHDSARCCLWHAATGVAAAPSLTAERLVFAEAHAADPSPAPYTAPAHPPGGLRARAPPPIA